MNLKKLQQRNKMAKKKEAMLSPEVQEYFSEKLLGKIETDIFRVLEMIKLCSEGKCDELEFPPLDLIPFNRLCDLRTVYERAMMAWINEDKGPAPMKIFNEYSRIRIEIEHRMGF